MNLPNKLTTFRIALIPVFIVLCVELPESLSGLSASAQMGNFITAYNGFIRGDAYIAAGIVFVIAFITDALDGFIARKYNLVTDLGKFLDPIADKLLVIAALIVLNRNGAVGVWATLIIISREFIITGVRLLAANKGIVLAADGLGKLKTITQSAALIMLLFRNFGIPFLAAVNAGGLIMYAAVVLTVISGAGYIIRNRTLFS